MNAASIIILIVLIGIVVLAARVVKKEKGCVGCPHAKEGHCNDACHACAHFESQVETLLSENESIKDVKDEEL